MDREALEEQGRRDQDRSRVANAGDGGLGADDEEFASVDDTGPQPGESPAVDDV